MKKISVYLVVLVLSFSMLVSKPVKAAGAEVNVEVSGEIKKGNKIDITLNLKDVSNLYGGDVKFLYDKELLSVDRIEVNRQLVGKVMMESNETDKSNMARYYYTLRGQDPGFTGSGKLLTIKATVLKDGKLVLTPNKLIIQLVEKKVDQDPQYMAFTANVDNKYLEEDQSNGNENSNEDNEGKGEDDKNNEGKGEDNENNENGNNPNNGESNNTGKGEDDKNLGGVLEKLPGAIDKITNNITKENIVNVAIGSKEPTTPNNQSNNEENPEIKDSEVNKKDEEELLTKEDNKNEEKESSNYTIIIAGIVILIAAGGGYFLYLKKGKKEE